MSAASEREWGIEYEVDSETTIHEWGMSEDEARAKAQASPTDTGVVSREKTRASEREALASLLASHPAISRGPGVAGSVCPTCPREINGDCNSLDHAEHLADAILAAGFTRQSRAEIQAEALANFWPALLLTVEGAYRERFREFEASVKDKTASEVHRARAFGRMDSLADLLKMLRAESLREGGE